MSPILITLLFWHVSFQASYLRQLEAPLLPNLLSLLAVQAPIQEFLGSINVLASWR